MGWYALYKWFAPWSKTYKYDVIYWYKEYVLKTPEQRERDKIQRERDAKLALNQLLTIHCMLKPFTDWY